jgi:PTS system mannose-specific IID component
MQNLGFAMSVIPLIGALRLNEKESRELTTRHLQLFNTHPYFSASVIGSVVKLEEEKKVLGDDSMDISAIKKSLMASYAAIGDIFFWGALRPFAVIFATFLIYMGFVVAPLAFLLIYTPVHLWIRIKGFWEGYQRGKAGFEFIRNLDLPSTAVKIRWFSLIFLAVLTVWLSLSAPLWSFEQTAIVVALGVSLALVLASLFLIGRGVSQTTIIYGSFFLSFLIISGKDFLN